MEVNEVENELKHWGILGMKWGIRRYQNPDGSLTPEGRERYSKTLNKAIESENTNYKIAVKAIDVMNSKLPEINAQFTDYYSKEYGDAISKTWKEIYGDFLKKEYGEIANLLYDDEIEWLSQFTYYNIYDDLNHSDFLQHWGILGMKWGIRNYQNPDGSLTPEGRIRYGVGPARTTGALLKGINDASSLSDEELRKMSRRYKSQAEYLQNLNEFLKQETYMRQQLAPKKEFKGPGAVGKFMNNVFLQPLQNFMAKNNEVAFGLIIYEMFKNSHPEFATQYFNAMSGLNLNKQNTDYSKMAKDAGARDRLYKLRTSLLDEIKRNADSSNNMDEYLKAIEKYEEIMGEDYDPSKY